MYRSGVFNKYRRRKIHIVIIGLLLSCLCFSLYLFYGKGEVQAHGSSNEYLKFPGFNPQAPTGTNENPFLILEIVPYRGMGQIGYLVGGQEPVDIDRSTYANPLWGPVNGVAQGAFEIVHKTSLDVGDVAEHWTWNESGRYFEPSNQWKFRNKEIFKREILHIPANHLDEYHVRVVTITPDKLNENVEKFSKYYDLSANGKYKKTLSGSNSNDEIDLIANADLISISPKAHAGSSGSSFNTVIDLWEEYGRDTSGISTSSGRYNLNFENRDLDWQTTLELFMKCGVVANRAALIYDITCITEPPGTEKSTKGLMSNEVSAGSINNVYKLCLMLRQFDPVEFYNRYLNTNGGEVTASVVEKTTSGGGTTGFFNKAALSSDDKVYWSEYTFLPSYPDGTKPSYISVNAYKNYLNGNDILVSWIAGGCHDAVIRNTYSYNGTSSIVQYFINSHEIKDNTYTEYDYNKKFFDYLEVNYNPRPANASPLQAVEYILNYNYNNISPNREIHILELQPCKDFSLTVEKVRDMLPRLLGNIRIEQQTTAKFIGKMEDLNSTYDMVYVGTNTGTMNTDSSGHTIYNDPELDGLIYLHVGDRVIGYDNLKGILKNSSGVMIKASASINVSAGDYTSRILKGYTSSALSSADFYRYSGNDITSIKRDELQDFVDAGNIVLLENSLYNCDNDIVDDSSYLYDFLSDNQLRSPMVNMDALRQLTTFEASRNKITNQLDKDKLTVSLTSYPEDYDDSDPSSRITDRTLTFKFKINKPTGADADDLYNWNVYVDINADGNFTAEESINDGQSKAGVQITSRRTLSEDYADVVPWKLKIVKQGASVIRTEKMGFAAFYTEPLSGEEREKTQIDVLQITSNSKSTANLEQLMNPRAGKTSLFYDYTRELKDFNVKIKTITVNDFMNLYSGAGNRYNRSDHEATDKLFLMKNEVKKPYDMIIFGFGDCYSDISNSRGALDNVQAFIDSGRSVMFTHDTTSFVNLSQEEYTSYANDLTFWGYGINQYLRNRMGLDRFGVMKEAGDTTPYDRATMPSQVNRYNYKSDPLTNSRTTYPEVQGITYPILVAFQNPGARTAIYNANRNYPPFNTNANKIDNGNSISKYQLENSYVTNVNEGQITSYPYDIPDRFQVAKTHGQYYQLNMDDPEIRVWYCLSDEVANEKGPYSTSPNDVRNNYYIFSKKNVMYTVVGHWDIDEIRNVGTTPTVGKINEVKLFINTMIAAYQAGVTGPEVEITNRDALKNGSGEYIFYENAVLPSSYLKRITFNTVDSNLAVTQLVIKIYYYNSAGTKILVTPIVRRLSNGSAAPKTSDNNGFYVIPENEYYFNLNNTSLDDFEAMGKDGFYIEVTNEEYNLKSGKSAYILERLLFDLD